MQGGIMKKKQVLRKYTVEEFEDGSARVTYNKDPVLDNGESTELESEGILFLAQHAEYFKKIVIGDSGTIGRLLFGSYAHSVKSASSGDLPEAYLALIMEEVSKDIVKISGMRKSSQDPEELLEAVGGASYPFDPYGRGISH